MKKTMTRVVSLAALSTAVMASGAQAACQAHMSVGSFAAATVVVSAAIAGAYLAVTHRKGSTASQGPLTAC